VGRPPINAGKAEGRIEVGERDNVYTFGSWLVKAGKEGDFILAWETFARWTGEHQPGMEGEARLLQDIEEPRRFISIGGWSDMRKVQTWRESPEFRDFFAKISELCEEMHPHVLKPVVRVAQKKR
jgi:heme-degrading monooxygenase HmoA